jgi:peptide deformylase
MDYNTRSRGKGRMLGMPVKNIVPFGEPVLRKTAKPITKFDTKLSQLLDDMADTLYAEEGRAGLAAPQVDVLKRVIVMDCGDGLIELINPEILEMSGEQTGTEACLSFPGYSGLVKRAKYVKIKTQSRNGKEILLEGEDFLAKCIQHEIDHLNGILYIDHIQEDFLIQDETNLKIKLADILRLSKP